MVPVLNMAFFRKRLEKKNLLAPIIYRNIFANSMLDAMKISKDTLDNEKLTRFRVAYEKFCIRVDVGTLNHVDRLNLFKYRLYLEKNNKGG